MVTINPAKMLHLDNRTGSIKSGKDADVVVWSAHPLSVYAKAEKTFVDGILFFDIEKDAERREQIKAERARLCIVADVKTKEFTDPNKIDAYDDHLMQLAAYRVGLGIPKAKCVNVFVSRSVPGLVSIKEWEEEDLQRGWEMFCSLLKFWQLKNQHS